MSFYVIEVGEGEIRSGIAKIAEMDTKKGEHGATIDITVDNVRIHLDTVDTAGLKRLLAESGETIGEAEK